MRKWTCCPSFSVDLNLNFAMKTLAGSDLQPGCPFLAIFYGVVISVNLSGVALRLDAADGEHEAPGGVGPVGADGQDAGDVEGADDFAAGAEFDLVPQVQAHQRVVDEQQAFAHWHADAVGEFHGAAPVPPSLPSTTIKSGRMPVSSMALAMPMNSHG